jgi:hypothetical protein
MKSTEMTRTTSGGITAPVARPVANSTMVTPNRMNDQDARRRWIDRGRRILLASRPPRL